MSLSENTDDRWLQAYLSEAIRQQLCTKIHCTTCGAMDFRRGLLVALTATEGRDIPAGFDRVSALAIGRALANVHSIAADACKFEEAVRLILFEVWSTLGEMEAERELEPALLGTWSGDVLARMKAHHKARQDARRVFAESQDPVRIEQRREEKRRLRQQKHVERQALKMERDRAWREKHG